MQLKHGYIVLDYFIEFSHLQPHSPPWTPGLKFISLDNLLHLGIIFICFILFYHLFRFPPFTPHYKSKGYLFNLLYNMKYIMCLN